MAQYVDVNGEIVEFPDGMSPDDIAQVIKTQMPQPAAVKAGGMLNEIPRQVGLTARYGLEGLANTAQIFTEPIRGIQDKITGVPSKPLGQAATGIADWMRLPSPQNANERTVGDATRLMAGSGGFMGAAKGIGGLLGDAGAKMVAPMVANPVSQLTAAGGGGMAAGASREAGGSNLEQFGAAALGTVAGGITPGVMNSVVNKIAQLRTSPMALEGKITLALREAGVDWQSIPANVRKQLVNDVRSATSTGGQMNPDAVRRLADFRMTGTTPTRGMLSLDPIQVTREQNLAKLGANSSDDALAALPMIQNRNNTQLINNVNRLGADRGNINEAGNTVVSAVTGRQAQLRGAERTAWDAARNSPGYTQPISSRVISDVNQALGDEALMPFMNPTISRYMESFQTGRPFTPQDYRNLQSMLAREVAKGGNEGQAASVARRILEQADIQPITNPRGIDFGNLPSTPQMAAAMRQADAAPAAAIGAVNHARRATRSAYAYEDSSPLVRSVLSDGVTSDPQRIAQRYIIGGTQREAATLANEVGPQGVDPIKNAILLHLKEKALNNASDEVGKFSQSAFNKAIKDIGQEKLRLFFSPEELQNLQANARASSYMQVQPVGSAVNNSNSGVYMNARAMEFIKSIAGKIPLGRQLVVDPLESIDVSLGERAATNIAPGLLMPNPPRAPWIAGPAAAGLGLLSAPYQP